MLFRCLQLLSARKMLPLPRVALLALLSRAARHHIGDHFTLSSCLPSCACSVLSLPEDTVRVLRYLFYFYSSVDASPFSLKA